MRLLEYISPSRLSLFRKDPKLFYRKYQADIKMENDPPTDAMMVGTCFDVFIKQWLIAEGVVEEAGDLTLPNNDWCVGQGRRICESYLRGGNGNVLKEMCGYGAVTAEVVANEYVEYKGTGVPLFGKPDLTVQGGETIVLDWKVNGGASVKRPSPVAGYTWRSKGGVSHKAAKLEGCGIPGIPAVSVADWGAPWIEQVCIYGWLLGVPVGEPFIGAIDQLCCSKEAGLEEVVRHRGMIGEAFQLSLWNELCDMWSVCMTGEYLAPDVRELLDTPAPDDSAFRSMLLS